MVRGAPTLSGWQENYPLAYEAAAPGGKLKPQMVLERLHALSPEDTIVASGVGQHQMWASQYWKFEHPYTWLNSGGLGTMGYLDSCRHRGQSRYARSYGVGCRWRRLFPDDLPGADHRLGGEDPDQGRVLEQQLPRHGSPVAGDVLREPVLRGRSRGSRCPTTSSCPKQWGAWRSAVEDTDEVDAVIDDANSINDRPVVVEFVTEPEENVYPMVPGGKSNSDIVVPPFQQKETAR